MTNRFGLIIMSTRDYCFAKSLLISSKSLVLMMYAAVIMEITTMLILTRKRNQGIFLDDDTCIKILSIRGGKVKLGIEAPDDVVIYREEIYEKVQKATIDLLLEQRVANKVKNKIDIGKSISGSSSSGRVQLNNGHDTHLDT